MTAIRSGPGAGSRNGPGRTRAVALAALTAAGTMLTATLGAGVAVAAPPVFPDNLVVFPDRDFVTIEGFQDRVGETATVEVRRAGQVVGSARGLVEAGDVAFEINHPGGYCWGAGTGLAVTPDIVAGDVVSIAFGGAVVGDTVVADAAVDAAPVLNGSTVTITGHVTGGVDPDFLEQRVVNPELTETDVTRRDIRAVPGPLTPAPKGGYASQLVVTGTTATATYVFDDPATAAIAAGGGGERMMSWQEQDADGNRQGLTIAEFGEAGGPGMGGCPLGPSQQSAPQPGQAAVVRSADRTSVQVSWTPATPQPGAAAVTGYSVVAIGETVTNGQQVQLGSRTTASATGTTISGLTATENYTVEVRSLAGALMSAPFTAAAPASGGGGGSGSGGTPNATFPAPTATVGPEGVVLAGPSGTEIYFTTDGSDPRVADLPSDTATLYTAPIVITAPDTVLNFVAFDANGNFSDTGTGTFGPVAPAGPAAPTAVAATAGDASATVTWTAPAGTPAPTKYVVTATPVSGSSTTPVVQEAPATATSLLVTRLTNGVDYDVTVTGYANTVAGAVSAPPVRVRPVASTIDRLTITTARWKVGDFRVVGTGSATGAVITVYRANADGTIGPVITGATATVTAPVAPATVGDFSIRQRAGGPATNPGRIFVRSDRGGVAGPFTVANG
jgi:hypothetical protein